MSNLKRSFLAAQEILNQFILDENNFSKIEKCVSTIVDSFLKNGKILICGNGGSLTDAMHFAEELTGRFRKDRKALPAISLSDPSHITCIGNDYGFEEIFSRGVEAFGEKKDIFIGLSTSGNSENIIKAFHKAKSKGLDTILLLGKQGGKLKGQADLEFIISADSSDRIQEMHMMILHVMVEGVERIMFPKIYDEL